MPLGLGLGLGLVSGRGVTFTSPASIFAGGAAGVWFDPSDLSTMFLSRQNGTVVTAAGQTVGLMLDKSRGLALGSELVTGQALNASPWSTQGAPTVGASSFTLSAGAAAGEGVALASIATVARVYRLTCDFTKSISGVVSIIGALSSAPTLGTLGAAGDLSGSISITFWATTTQIYFRGVTVGQTVTLSNVSIKEIAGSHISQATGANRPLYQSSGGVSWLELDGANDRLNVASFTSGTMAQPITVWAGGQITTAPPGATSILWDGGTASNRIRGECLITSGNYVLDAGASLSAGALTSGMSFVGSHMASGASSRVQLDNNTPVIGAGGANSMAGVTIGSDSTGASLWAGRFHGLVIAAGNQEAAFGASMRAWMAAKQGRSL